MENELLHKIITQKIPCYFVSPHFDDAILSAGDLIAYLDNKTKVSVINVFTKAGNIDSFSAKKFLKDSGHKNAKILFIERDKEDQKAFSHLNIKRINLGFIDALWRDTGISKTRKLIGRFIPEFGKIYPTYRFNIVRGKVSKFDEQTISDIVNKLKTIVKEKNAIIFCPLGIGNHVDHLVTQKACKKLNLNLVLWADFPYSIRKHQSTNSNNNYDMSFVFTNNKKLKTKLIKNYKSQFKGLFQKTGFKLTEEKYYIFNKLKSRSVYTNIGTKALSI